MPVLIPFGLAVGITMGTLGAGGSILAIPVLVHVGGLDAHAATSTSLAVVGVGALGGLLPHWQAHRVHVGAGLAFGVVGAGGTVLGSWVNRRLSDDALLVGFALLAVVMAVLIARHSGVAPPAGDALAVRGRWARIAALGTGVGFLTGLFGVGGGFVVVPALVLVAGFPMRDAVGTSLLVIALNAGTALLARMPDVAVDWSVAAPFAGAGLVGVVAGSLVARRAPAARLGFALAGLLVVVAGVLGLPAAGRLAS